MKACTKCGVEKPLEDFSKDKSNPDGLRQHCRKCRSVAWKSLYRTNPEKWKQRVRDWDGKNPDKRREIQKRADLKGMYGLSLEDYERMRFLQGGKCLICSETMNPPHVDHCHKTGLVRGLLCPRCNPALGGFRDSPQLLARAAGYLRQSVSGIDETFCGDAGC